MNTFFCQSIQSQIELEEIADVKLQIITPQSSSPIIGLVQDGLVGGYCLTINNDPIDWRTVMNILSITDIDDLYSINWFFFRVLQQNAKVGNGGGVSHIYELGEINEIQQNG